MKTKALSIGDIVHFHPTVKARQAAIITEIHPLAESASRPHVNLIVLAPETNTKDRGVAWATPQTCIKPLDLDPSESLDGKQKNFWAFKDEFEIQTPPDKTNSQLKGSESNALNTSNDSIYGED